jgi:hypothetical protein
LTVHAESNNHGMPVFFVILCEQENRFVRTEKASMKVGKHDFHIRPMAYTRTETLTAKLKADKAF